MHHVLKHLQIYNFCPSFQPSTRLPNIQIWRAKAMTDQVCFLLNAGDIQGTYLSIYPSILPHQGPSFPTVSSDRQEKSCYVQRFYDDREALWWHGKLSVEPLWWDNVIGSCSYSQHPYLTICGTGLTSCLLIRMYSHFSHIICCWDLVFFKQMVAASWKCSADIFSKDKRMWLWDCLFVLISICDDGSMPVSIPGCHLLQRFSALSICGLFKVRICNFWHMVKE